MARSETSKRRESRSPPSQKRQRRYHLDRVVRDAKRLSPGKRIGVNQSKMAEHTVVPVEDLSIMLDKTRVRCSRAGSGPALLLVHGLLGYSFSWRHTIPFLAGQATVYALDQPGAGYSDPPPDMNCCLHSCAERLLRFMDATGIRDCDLLGTSHGGAVAMITAAARACWGKKTEAARGSSWFSMNRTNLS
jgi:pimeloyl-ACP methyl ester carboxylesterase